ncbi:MAG TPA: hypothetical protein VGK94_00950 [Candidatus Polarisedimenticolia bacterium]|jgi:hypothetical protein
MSIAHSWKSHAFKFAAASIIFAAGHGLCRAAEEPPRAADESVTQMRAEIEELKSQLRALKDQVDALARAQAGTTTPVAQVPAAPPPAPQPPPAPVSRAGGSTVFNPAMSAVFQGIGNGSFNHNRDGDGFSLSEAEIGLQAVVDPYARVDMFIAFGAEGEAEVEEAYVTFQTLPGGLQAKAGRFKDAFGKWNLLHNHAFFTVDRPNALTNFFGEESLTGDGASLSWLVPGTGSAFVESVTDIASTGNDVSFNARRRDLLLLEHVSSVFTLTSNATFETGGTWAKGRGGPSEALTQAIDDAGLTGTVVPSDRLAANLFGVDLTYKWKPVQFNVYRSVTLQAEGIASRRRVESLQPGGFLTRDTVNSFGGYLYAEYQFAKRWRAGLRYDDSEFPDDDSARERAASAVLRIQPTEFEEFRIQFKHTGRNDAAAFRFDGIQSDNEVFIEWIPVIGAHAAHKY